MRERPSIAGESEALLTARRPSFPSDQDIRISAGSPKSPRHKFSDSHSSLSSYTSSSRSGCHSRISSLSTVSGIHPLSSLLSDVPEAKVEPNDLPTSQHFSDVLSPRNRLHHANSSPPALTRGTLPYRERQQSPSDAILITRGSLSHQSSPGNGTRYVFFFSFVLGFTPESSFFFISSLVSFWWPSGL